MNEWIPHHLLSFFSDLLDSLLTSVSVFYLFLPIYSPLIPSGGFIQNTDGLGFKMSFSSLLPTGFRLWPSTPPLPASHHFSWTVLQLGRPHHAPSWPAFWNAPSSPRELLLLFLEILLKEYPFFRFPSDHNWFSFLSVAREYVQLLLLCHTVKCLVSPSTDSWVPQGEAKVLLIFSYAAFA